MITVELNRFAVGMAAVVSRSRLPSGPSTGPDPIELSQHEAGPEMSDPRLFSVLTVGAAHGPPVGGRLCLGVRGIDGTLRGVDRMNQPARSSASSRSETFRLPDLSRNQVKRQAVGRRPTRRRA